MMTPVPQVTAVAGGSMGVVVSEDKHFTLQREEKYFVNVM